MEKLRQWIRKKAGEGRLREVKASRNGPGLNHLFIAYDLLLFVEAHKEHLLCLKEGFDFFCRCPSQRNIFQKSSMFFSSNVHEEEAQQLSAMMDIPMKKDVGKYLGHHIVVKGSDKERHKNLLLCIQRRVAGWKLHCLSRVDRLTLAKSVLGSLPVFNMQLERLPDWVHKEIKKSVRKRV